MSDTDSVRSNCSTLSTGAGFDETGPFLVTYSGLTGEMRVLRPGTVLAGGLLGGCRRLKEGDVIWDGFFSKYLRMPRTCDSPYVTPNSSPDASPELESSKHDGKALPENMQLPPSF